MKDTNWFNRDFIQFCLGYDIEPVINGDEKLMLVCPKIPSQEVQQAILKWVPQDQPSEFKPFLRTMTRSLIGILVASNGAKGVDFGFKDNHGVMVNVVAPSGMTFSDDMWNKIAYLVKNDPHTETFEIYLNRKIVRNSSSPNAYEDKDMFGEEGVDFDPPSVAKEKPTVVPTIKDDRFDYDRDFLPKDVGTDVKILLESTNTVEEFLKSIGG